MFLPNELVKLLEMIHFFYPVISLYLKRECSNCCFANHFDAKAQYLDFYNEFQLHTASRKIVSIFVFSKQGQKPEWTRLADKSNRHLILMRVNIHAQISWTSFIFQKSSRNKLLSKFEVVLIGPFCFETRPVLRSYELSIFNAFLIIS